VGKPFKGIVNIDIKDSVPDWEPYTQPIAPEGAPNFLYVVLDDVGFSAMEPFGGLIETPNINRIAERGLVYSNFHTTALCSPTRSCLMTGRNHTTNGMASITEASSGFPSSNGPHPVRVRDGRRGARRAWLEHVHDRQVAPDRRGRDEPRVAQDPVADRAGLRALLRLPRGGDQPVVSGPRLRQPSGRSARHSRAGLSPDHRPHRSRAVVHRRLQGDRARKPFFLYYCPGTCHAPHHAPKEWIEKYKGKFDMGYEEYRELVFERQKQLGILPDGAELSPINPYIDETSADGAKGWPELDTVRPWDSLSDDERTLFCRMAEVYAGFLSHADHELGRLLGHLDESGELDNTIIVLVSDNGASGEGGPSGSVNENKLFNGLPDKIEENLPYLDELGGPRTYNHYPTGWACAFNTPFKLWKRYANWEGGTADPMIVSWPAGIKETGVRRQYAHAVDIVPTIYECLGIEPPDVVKGHTQLPIEGVSFAPTFDDPAAKTGKQTQFFSMGGTRAIWHDGWKAAALSPSAPDMWAGYETQRWELFDVENDPSECHDLAAQHPDKLQELISLWWAEAGRYGALPLENRGVVEILTTERPQLSKPRNRYTYYPGGSEVPESVAPNLRNRSYTIAVEATIQSEEAGGVLFAHGSRFGGHALYIKDRKLIYVYNWVGMFEQVVESTEPVPMGHVVLSASFDREGDGMPPEGTLTLHMRERAVGDARIKTQPGKFSIAGEGLNVGREGAEAVTDDYPGDAPWAFVGGTIHKCVIDVSGEPFVDLANEAAMAFARD
jgi:arylsulfatase A-like enzyme